MIAITANERTLNATDELSVLLAEGKYVLIGDLKVGDEVRVYKGTATVDNIQHSAFAGRAYDFQKKRIQKPILPKRQRLVQLAFAVV